MSILVSPRFSEELRAAGGDEEATLRAIVGVLERLNSRDISAHTLLHRVAGAADDIYVLRHHALRVFFTQRGDDLILLSVVAKG